jgi:PBP1b-binding outer membrane lipoprotein LpoB
MHRVLGVLAVAFVMVSCSAGDEAPVSTNKCATNLFPAYDPKDLKQCVNACIKCKNGVTTTCTTSCTLKGAR